ncbi:MAG: NAD(+) synthase [Coprothermobacterota bacterium]|nr:NAD(+) synthase [Coprothermobacterota bacterium]
MNTARYLSKDVFAFDVAFVCDGIAHFLADTMFALRREGILIPLSGGLDSSTVATLAVNAVGSANVIGLMLPERQGNPDAEHFAGQIARVLGIALKRIDISPILARTGTYDFLLSRIPTKALRDKVVKAYWRVAGTNPFLDIIRGTGNGMQRRGFSVMNSKHRVRLVMTYRLAEEINYLVAGAAHKSEDLLGLFVKFGVDDAADIMPLKNLYRSQILQLAEYLGVPDEIICRTPNPDIIAGISDKYFDVLGIHAETIDLILYGLIEARMECAQIAEQLQIPMEKVQEIQELIQLTEHMRQHSIAPMIAPQSSS